MVQDANVNSGKRWHGQDGQAGNVQAKRTFLREVCPRFFAGRPTRVDAAGFGSVRVDPTQQTLLDSKPPGDQIAASRAASVRTEIPGCPNATAR